MDEQIRSIVLAIKNHRSNLAARFLIDSFVAKTSQFWGAISRVCVHLRVSVLVHCNPRNKVGCLGSFGGFTVWCHGHLVAVARLFPTC